MEIWKSIPNYEGLYEVSNYGNVRSLDREVIDKNGKILFKKGKILKKLLNDYGYFHVILSKQNKLKTHTVHRLVGIAFIDNPYNKIEINHINGIKTDNRVDNLEWCTRSENELHSYRVLGKIYISPTTGKTGELSHKSKRVLQYYNDILINEYCSTREAGKINNINEKNIASCCRIERNKSGGYSWKYK